MLIAHPAVHNNIIPFTLAEDRPMTILIVEDDRLQRSFLEESVRNLGHQMLEAENGAEALEVLKREGDRIDIILMDRIMPIMDGLTAVRRIKEDIRLQKIPIIMVTGASSVMEIREGLEADVFYYLNKPVDHTILTSVLAAAVREVEQRQLLYGELRRHHKSFHLIDTCKFHYRSLEEAECLAAFIANCFPDPNRAVQGLAELMINAVEHGNLNIGYQKKTELIEDGTWRAEIERRLSLDDYRHKSVEVAIARRDDGIYAVITDQGNGFNWQRFMSIDPARAGDNHGRGIAQANALSFDRLTYNAQGNQVVAFSGKDGVLNW